MPIPFFGTDQGHLPFDGFAPFVRSMAWQHWRNADGVLAPLTRQAVTFMVRTSAASIDDSEGTSWSVPAAAPAWTAVDWDDDGIREELVLRLSDEEALRFADAESQALFWPTARDVTVLHEWVWGDIGPLWSLSRDDGSGAYLLLEATIGGHVTFTHHNGTTPVSSAISSALASGDRCSARLELRQNGSVRAALVKNGGGESLGTASGALTPAALWGTDGTVQARINEFGDGIARGVQDLRTSLVMPGLWTRDRIRMVL